MMKDSIGKWRTQSLFTETNKDPSITPMATLKEAHDIYIELADPTEYEFAMKFLGSWEHWKKLTEAKFFTPILESWREELEVKIRSKGIKQLAESAMSDGARGVGAAKWLAEGQWRENKRGRPSKAEVERQRRIYAGIDDEVGSDLDRLRLN